MLLKPPLHPEAPDPQNPTFSLGCSTFLTLGLLGLNFAYLPLRRVILGSSWPLLGRSWSPLRPSSGHLGAILGSLEALSGPSWALVGPSWSHLGSSWGHLGPCCHHLGPSWPHSGPTWSHLGLTTPPRPLRRPQNVTPPAAPENEKGLAVGRGALQNI